MPAWLKVVAKWLVITSVVVVVFSSVLLFLGYLLHDNEQRVSAYQQQINQHKENDKSQADKVKSLITLDDSAELKQQAEFVRQAKRIVEQHLTCHSDQQCRIFQSGQPILGCQIAINQIGHQMLNDLKKIKQAAQCSTSTESVASCQNNLCSIQLAKVN